MRRRVGSVLALAVILAAISVLVPRTSAWSVEPRESIVAQDIPNATLKRAREIADSVSLPMSELRIKRVKRYVHDVGILQRMIYGRLTLSSKQRANIEKMFKEHLVAARDNDGAAYRWVDPGPATKTPKDLYGLREEWKKKMADGTAPAIPRAHIFEHPAEFLVAISFEINEDQLDQYDTVAKRWHMLMPGVGGDGPIRHILRAVNDMELTISVSLRMEMRKHVISSMRKFGNARKDPKKLAVFCAEMRKHVLSKLTTEQQAHFVKTLDQLGKDAARFKASN